MTGIAVFLCLHLCIQGKLSIPPTTHLPCLPFLTSLSLGFSLSLSLSLSHSHCLIYRVNDTGLLSYKDHLPLREIAIGDTNRTGSEVVFKIGPLRCYGNSMLFSSHLTLAETLPTTASNSSYIHFILFRHNGKLNCLNIKESSVEMSVSCLLT